jgi:hypothetical protein
MAKEANVLKAKIILLSTLEVFEEKSFEQMRKFVRWLINTFDTCGQRCMCVFVC